MFDFVGMLKEAFGLAREVLHRVTGGRTREQNRLEKELLDALDAKREALAMGLMDTANMYDDIAGKLRREISSKYPAG